MRKKVKELCCVLLAVMLCIGMSVPAMAASSKYNAAIASYKRYMRGKNGSYRIKDIDLTTAITNWMQAQYSYQASLQVTSASMGMSLLNYL